LIHPLPLKLPPACLLVDKSKRVGIVKLEFMTLLKPDADEVIRMRIHPD
jgi:hypothetical protein